MARELVPLLLEGMPRDDTPAGRAVALLDAWNFEMQAAVPQPLLLYAWLRGINSAIFADELGAAFEDYDSWNPNGIAHVLTAAPRWCDDTGTPEAEDCAWARAEGLRRGLDWLADLGAEVETPEALAWGDWHVARLQHALLGRVPLLGDAYAETHPIGGGNYTVKRATPSWSAGRPFRVVHGAGLRAVFDLADLERSSFMITSGQSGNPFSPHFLTFARMWADGDYLKLVGREPAAGGRLVLRPR
jgi:penicillin amidase